jgi:hypothetical protein
VQSLALKLAFGVSMIYPTNSTARVRFEFFLRLLRDSLKISIFVNTFVHIDIEFKIARVIMYLFVDRFRGMLVSSIH